MLRPLPCSTSHRLFFSFDAGENRKREYQKGRFNYSFIQHKYQRWTTARGLLTESFSFPVAAGIRKVDFSPVASWSSRPPPCSRFFSFIIILLPPRENSKVSTDDAPVKVKTRIIYNQKADDPLLDTQCYISVCLSLSLPPLFPRPGRCWPAPSSNQATSSSSSLLSSSLY